LRGRASPTEIDSGSVPTFAVTRGVFDVKNCKLCRYSKVCNDLPGICVLLQYAAIGLLVSSLAYLFITQELLS